MEGVVEEVNVDRGDVVHEGQVLAQLESTAERASVEFARVRAQGRGPILSGQARLDFANRSLERQRGLEERNVVSKSEMDEAMSAQRVAAAQLQEAQEARQEAEVELRRAEALLQRRQVKSPIDGVVVERMLSPGEYADPPAILRLAQIDPLRVEVFAPLGLYGKIQSGMKAEVVPEEPVGGRYVATVTVVDRVIDPASATFGIRLELPNPDHALPAGLNCRVRFPVDAPDLADSTGSAPRGSASVRLRSLVAVESSAARDPALAARLAVPLERPPLPEPTAQAKPETAGAALPSLPPEPGNPAPQDAELAKPAEPGAQDSAPAAPSPGPQRAEDVSEPFAPPQPTPGSAAPMPVPEQAVAGPKPDPAAEPGVAEAEPAVPDAVVPDAAVSEQEPEPEPAPEAAAEPGVAKAEPPAAPAAAKPEPKAASRPVRERAAEPEATPPPPPPRLVPIRVSAEPGTRIEMDGQGLGSAPIDGVRVPVGRRRFVARRPHGSVMQRTVDVSDAGQVVVF
jgi:RND family efflux transporter MFP subunit